MTKFGRNYSPKTLKILFALSGNECAHPECTNRLIADATEESDHVVIANICHIDAISPDGPRGKPGLAQDELNAPDNLLLLCPNHHALVDGQHETYSADTLRRWKQNHESKMRERLFADGESVPLESSRYPNFPTSLIDQKIDYEIDVLRKSRFFVEFDTARSSLTLGIRIFEGELYGGTDAVKCRALAWCARLLSRTDELGKASEYLTFAKGLGTCPETDIADAFVASQNGNKGGALKTLAGIDSPASRSAALMIVAHHEGTEGALDWLKDTAIEAADLDPEGKHFLLTSRLKLKHWDAASDILMALEQHDFREAPILHHMAALTQLMTAVSVELRSVVLNHLPFAAAEFPLASDESAMNARREAQRHFVDAAVAAHELNLPDEARLADAYALWLELSNPVTADNGRRRLHEKFRDANQTLSIVPLGLQFGIKLDLAAVEKEIGRQIALNGEVTRDVAIARFSLAFHRKSPEDVANYVDHHYDELAKFLDTKALRFLQVEMLSQAGLPEKANKYLELLLKDGLSDAEERRLRRIVSAAEGADGVQVRKAQFEESNSLGDLASLVSELETTQRLNDLCQYGASLFERTHAVRDAERLVTAFYNTQRMERVLHFLQANSDLLSQSDHLQMLHAWALYYDGALVESRNEFVKLSYDARNSSYRALQVNLGIALGNWDSLSTFVANEYQQRDKRNVRDLMGAGQLALQIGSSHARDLIFAAVEKGEDDPTILATAYFLASGAGWEGDPQVVEWLNNAVKLSGVHGPLQRMSLKEILEQKPEWDRRESETWQLLGCGKIPMSPAARSLHKSLIDLMLFPALANLAENDPRRRSAIPAYSGRRQPMGLDSAGATAGMDPTALLTLSFLDLLDEALDAFKTIWMPHSTLAWLFEEEQKATFHQPSRIKDAHHIRDLLATDLLEKFVPSTVASSDLSAQVGDELAALIAEAEKHRDDDDTQRLVVRSSPVHRMSSLMEEEADLTAHAAVMSSCLAVVKKLQQTGQITAQEETRARAYLQVQERPWPRQPEIVDHAVLYLDDLAITYFLRLGILGKLKAGGLRAIASPRKVSEADALIAYEGISEKVKEKIERIRSAVSERIASGKVKVGRHQNVGESRQQSMPEDPMVGVIALAQNCDAIISDDRYLNQHDNISHGGAHAQIFTTLDLLDVLVATAAISGDERWEHRTRLRRAGYFFMPFGEDELSRYLNGSAVEDNQVIETAELKAIRENILRVRMSDWLQLPEEMPWLETTLKVFGRVLKSLWKEDAEVPATARSHWIADQIDIRGWAHSFEPENGDNIVRISRAAQVLLLLTPPSDVSKEVKDAYWNWAEERILAPIKEQFPDLYSWIVNWQRGEISKIAEMEPLETETT